MTRRVDTVPPKLQAPPLRETGETSHRVTRGNNPKDISVNPRERRLLDQIDKHSQQLVQLSRVDLPRLRGQAERLREEGLDTVAKEIDVHADRLQTLAQALDVDSMQLLALTDPHLDDTVPVVMARRRR